MKTQLTLGDILPIEDSSALSEICCSATGIPLWTTIRVPFLRLILGDMLYGTPFVGGEGVLSSRSGLGRAATISRSFIHNALQFRSLDRQYPIMVVATGARVVERDGLNFNCLSDYFVAQAPDQTYVIEDLFGWKWPFPRQYSNVLLQTPMRVEAVVKGRMGAARFREAARALLDMVSRRAKALLDWDIGEVRQQWLEKVCANSAASFLPRYRSYQAAFRKTGARLLIKEEACYGGADNASAILAAKHLGIVTAEYQHGAVSSGHDAYNFAPAILSGPAYQQIFPDYFLAYGSWWGEQINVPSKKLAIGNPHRAAMLGGSVPQYQPGQKILVLGDGIETALYLALCEQLAASLSHGTDVMFRPHPLERARVRAKHPAGLVGVVQIDMHPDIYDSFHQAAAVVSEISTGLFEAIGLVPKIFIWDTPKSRFGYPTHPFERFSEVSELARLVLDEEAGRVSSQQLESIWAVNWQKNYLDFAAKAIET